MCIVRMVIGSHIVPPPPLIQQVNILHRIMVVKVNIQARFLIQITKPPPLLRLLLLLLLLRLLLLLPLL